MVALRSSTAWSQARSAEAPARTAVFKRAMASVILLKASDMNFWCARFCESVATNLAPAMMDEHASSTLCDACPMDCCTPASPMVPFTASATRTNMGACWARESETVPTWSGVDLHVCTRSDTALAISLEHPLSSSLHCWKDLAPGAPAWAQPGMATSTISLALSQSRRPTMTPLKEATREPMAALMLSCTSVKPAACLASSGLSDSSRTRCTSIRDASATFFTKLKLSCWALESVVRHASCLDDSPSFSMTWARPVAPGPMSDTLPRAALVSLSLV
mmetsp:Transcript_33864/g.85004  ORF Transcript_33864/g.85004 Transcript_33864/m.85004 type:complete len:277 (-) Transcript_33864:1156-1986(-)